MSYKLLNITTKNIENLKILYYKRSLYIKDLKEEYKQLKTFDEFYNFYIHGCNIYWGYEEEVEFGYLDNE
jgi:hypothetical protein